MESTITIIRNGKTITIWAFIWEAMTRCKGG